MNTRVGINGFGRIGMLVARAAMQNGGNVEIVAINDTRPNGAWCSSSATPSTGCGRRT